MSRNEHFAAGAGAPTHLGYGYTYNMQRNSVAHIKLDSAWSGPVACGPVKFNESIRTAGDSDAGKKICPKCLRKLGEMA